MSVEQAMKIHAELVKLRDERITRFVGFSAHGYFDKVLALISSGGFDQCMLSHGYIPRGYDQIWTARMTTLRDACVAKAHELGMGIVAMKVVGAGLLGAWSGHVVPGFDKQRLRQLPGAAIRHVLQDQRTQDWQASYGLDLRTGGRCRRLPRVVRGVGRCVRSVQFCSAGGRSRCWYCSFKEPDI